MLQTPGPSRRPVDKPGRRSFTQSPRSRAWSPRGTASAVTNATVSGASRDGVDESIAGSSSFQDLAGATTVDTRGRAGAGTLLSAPARPTRLPFVSVYCSSDVPDRAVSRLEVSGLAGSGGWLSDKRCCWPVELGLRVFGDVKLSHIKLTSHDTHVASRMEVFRSVPTPNAGLVQEHGKGVASLRREWHTLYRQAVFYRVGAGQFMNPDLTAVARSEVFKRQGQDDGDDAFDSDEGSDADEQEGEPTSKSSDERGVGSGSSGGGKRSTRVKKQQSIVVPLPDLAGGGGSKAGATTENSSEHGSSALAHDRSPTRGKKSKERTAGDRSGHGNNGDVFIRILLYEPHRVPTSTKRQVRSDTIALICTFFLRKVLATLLCI